jgi:hypothetical protein
LKKSAKKMWPGTFELMCWGLPIELAEKIAFEKECMEARDKIEAIMVEQAKFWDFRRRMRWDMEYPEWLQG